MSNNKILVVEDSPIQRIKLKLDLELESFEVITANDGIDGVNKAYSESPDIIISDIMIPKLNGYQFCRLLKNDPHTNHIPIILLTNLKQQRDKFWGAEAGADSYLFKKNKMQELLDEINRLLKNSHTRKKTYQVDVNTSELHGENVKSRINHMLDQLLFESTISNRIREIAKFAYNPHELMINFFKLLSQLVNYAVAGVMIEQQGVTHLFISLNKPCELESLKKIKIEILNQRNLKNKQSKIKYELLGKEHLCNNKQIYNSNIVVPFPIKDNVLGTISVYDKGTSTNTDKNEQVLHIISKELAMLIKYLLKIEEIDTIKADFTSMIVHDLRSPMAGVLGLLNLMRDGKIGSVNSQQYQILSQVLVTLNKLLNLVNDVLDISKIEADHLDVDLKPIQLSEIIDI